MTKRERKIQKEAFISELAKCGGYKTVACANVRLHPRTLYRWLREDDEFRQAVEDAVTIAREFRDDEAEQKLFDNVRAGDVASVIFYAKTRLKGRGYSEKVAQEPKAQQPEQVTIGADVQRQIAAKSEVIIDLLKSQNMYTPDLALQVSIVAQLLVRTDILATEIFDEGHKPINVEISREGNERESISPKERLYLDFLQQSQKALKALGMNMDARKVESVGEDGLTKLLNEFSDGDK